MSIFGISIVKSPLAVQIKRRPVITKNPIAKRRRTWLLRYETVELPCMFEVGTTLYVHPTIYDRMKAAVSDSALKNVLNGVK